MGKDEIAVGIVDGLKSQPLALALIVMNFMFLIGAWWLISEVADRNKTQNALIMQMAKECASK